MHLILQALFLRALQLHSNQYSDSFPDTFIFYGSLSNQYKLVGNAVPPLMAYSLAKSLGTKKESEGEFLLI